MDDDANLMHITPTKHGFRLSQHGVVISEVRTSPGPTHSVFDVLAALIATLQFNGRIGVLGFAGGGMLAPLRALGVDQVIDSVDLDRNSYELFRRHCPAWTRHVRWQQADAVEWLRGQPPEFGLLLDDLSVPYQQDVIKPDVSWSVLPELIHERLREGGIGIFNLMLSPGSAWKRELPRITNGFDAARIIELQEFENRILVAGPNLPTARRLGNSLKPALERLGSRQAGRLRIRTLKHTDS